MTERTSGQRYPLVTLRPQPCRTWPAPSRGGRDVTPGGGKRVEVKVIDIMRFGDAGLVCEHWGLADMLSMLQQLGVVPA